MPTPEQFNLIRDTFGLPFQSIEAAEREVVGQQRGTTLAVAPGQDNDRSETTLDVTAPATDASRQWQGWGTALKPALEPITVARKPLIGTVAENVLEHGTGALNIDGCRVEGEKPSVKNVPFDSWRKMEGRDDIQAPAQTYDKEQGRWPANLIHDGGEESVEAFGEASRFFYCPKASKSDRGAGNVHPTVKPTDLMRYLCKLVTHPGGIVLDPFMGSGSTGKAAKLEGFEFIGIELDPEYCKISEARINNA